MKRFLSLLLAALILIPASAAFAEDFVRVQKITPGEPAVTMPPGTVWEIYLTIEPANATNKEIEWSSSNESVAAVTENGVIRALSEGKCQVIAAATDGSGRKASVHVTVQEHEIVILEPGRVNVDFETENKSVTREKVVKGETKTQKLNRYFTTRNECVTSPEDMVLLPVKAGSDLISMLYQEKKKNTVLIERHTVFVSRSAVGEAARLKKDGTPKPIRFLTIPWGSSYPEVRNLLKNQGRSVGDVYRNNSQLRAVIGDGITFANTAAYRAALDFTYDRNTQQFTEKNTLVRGILYFDPEIPEEAIVQGVRTVYGLGPGNVSETSVSWERDGVQITLSRKERFTALEYAWNGIPQEEEEEEDEPAFEDIFPDEEESAFEEPEGMENEDF